MFRSVKKLSACGLALGALALGGSALANAATSSSSNTTSTTGTTAPARPPANFPAHGTAAHEDAEKTVTGESATKAQEAAIKSLGGGTAGEVTTNFTGNGYEVTVTKSDGSKVEVHLDNSFNVIQGPPGHAGWGRPNGPPPAPGA
jgi:hypothetical protein